MPRNEHQPNAGAARQFIVANEIRRRSIGLVRALFPIVRGNPALRRRAAVLKKVPGLLAVYRRLDNLSKPTDLSGLSPRAQRFYHDLKAPGGPGRAA
jgi:hypothetical protein